MKQISSDEDEKEKTNEQQPQEESKSAETSGKLTTSKTKSSYFLFMNHQIDFFMIPLQRL